MTFISRTSLPGRRNHIVFKPRKSLRDSEFKKKTLIVLNDLLKYVTSMFIFGYLLPSVIFLFSYGLVCFKIRSTNKNMERHGNLNGQKQRQRNSRPLKLIAGLVITYLVCYTPFHMYHLLRTMDVYLLPSSCTTFKRTHEA